MTRHERIPRTLRAALVALALCACSRPDLSTQLSTLEPTRLTARWAERDRVLVDRVPHGDLSMEVYESALDFTGDLVGGATSRSHELTSPTGAREVQRTVDFSGLIFGNRGTLRLGMAGDDTSGAVVISSDLPGSYAITGEGTFQESPQGLLGSVDMEAIAVSTDVVLSFGNEDSEGRILLARQNAKQLGGDRSSMIVPLLKVKNEDPVHNAHVTHVEVYVGLPWTPAKIWAGDTVPPGETVLIDNSTVDNLYMWYPPPLSLKVKVSMQGGSTRQAVRTLRTYKNANWSGQLSYLFPIHTDELATGTYWSGGKPHAGDSQRYGHDMHVVRWNGSEWDNVKPGKSGTHPTHYLAYGVKIYAMADGEVEACHWSEPDNPDTNEDDPLGQHGSGNHFLIRHGEELAKYAHMRAGSVNMNLCQVGDPIQAGDLLGEVGNTGSGSPHLHIDVTKDGRPLPILFRAIQVVNRGAFDPITGTGPWTVVDRFAIARPTPHLIKTFGL